MKRRPWTAVVLLGLFLPTACSPGWQQFKITYPMGVPERQIIAFESGGKTWQLHAVSIMRDSISGIPWTEHTDCDTCRVVFARKDISNVRTGNPGRGGWTVLGPVLAAAGAVVILAIVVCGIRKECASPGD